MKKLEIAIDLEESDFCVYDPNSKSRTNWIDFDVSLLGEILEGSCYFYEFYISPYTSYFDYCKSEYSAGEGSVEWAFLKLSQTQLYLRYIK